MEAKSSSGEEEVVLTPASSRASCEGGSSQSDGHDDFVGLMDENGIIGLLEALEIVGVGEYSDDGGSCHKVPAGLPAPVETETQSDDWSGSPAGDVQIRTHSPGQILTYFNLNCVWSGRMEIFYRVSSVRRSQQRD